MFDLSELQKSSSSRRMFLATMTAAGLGLAARNLLGAGLKPPTAPTGSTGPAGIPTDGAAQFAGIPGRNVDEQVLNFALTLEILEADLYRQALNLASGLPLSTPLPSSTNYQLKVPTGGLSSTAAAAGFLYLQQFAQVEAAHREFLKAAISSGGGTPVAPAAKGYKFPKPPAANLLSILGAILPLEETGERAYLGALPYLDNLSLAQVAGTIFSTEARHSAAIAYLLNIDPGPRLMNGDLRVTSAQPSQNTFEYFLQPKTVIGAVPAYLA